MNTAALPSDLEIAPAPRYERVSQAIADFVVRVGLGAGARLPSERELSARFAVSRVTVRRALAQLAQQGLIAPSHGLGWLVAREPHSRVEEAQELVSFSAMAAARGLAASSRVLLARIRPAELDQAEMLRSAPGEALVELRRLRLFNDMPIAVSHSLVPAALAPGLLETDFTTASLFETLAQKYGRVPTSADYVLEAGPADEELASLLDLVLGEPVLHARSTTFDQTGRPIELGHVSYRWDRFRFHTHLHAHVPGPPP